MTDIPPGRDYARDYVDGNVPRGQAYDDSISGLPFDAFMARREAEMVPMILRQLHPGGVPRCLDFACGTGRITQVLEPCAHERWAVDISQQMMDRAREKCPNTTFVLADPSSDTLPVDDIDVVTAFRYFGNAPDEQRHRTLKKISAALKEGGHLVTNNHRNSWTFESAVRRIRGGRVLAGLSYWHLRDLLIQYGLKLVRTYPVGAWLLRGKWFQSKALLESSRAQRLDRVFGSGLLSPLAPDLLLVARKEPVRR